MACSSFVWKDSGKRWDRSHCCSSCHEDDELGYFELGSVELTDDDDSPGWDAHAWRDRVYVSVCCRISNDREHLRYSPEKDDDG